MVQVVQQAGVRGLQAVLHHAGGLIEAPGDVRHILAQTGSRDHGFLQRGIERIARMAHQTRRRQVRQQNAERDGQQQQRLELLDDRQIQQRAGGNQHDIAPAIAILDALGDTGRLRNAFERVDDVDIRIRIRLSRFLNGGVDSVPVDHLVRHVGRVRVGFDGGLREGPHGQQAEQDHHAREAARKANLFEFEHW